jgi:glutamyl-Q tRNA(Asp) synthetase
MQYIGRFAPSPTGPLHFGSLVAAVAGYCDAKANGGKWLVRMEDLDKPRETKGAADDILRTLEAFGFEWDCDGFNTKIMYQSQRDEIYAEAFNTLQKQNLIYPCTCTRKEIADSSNAQGIDGLIYPRTCRTKVDLKWPTLQSTNIKTNGHAAYRAIVLDKNISFTDTIQGEITQNLAKDVGDFILKRKDGMFAYQLAVVVDDAMQGITHIVRGADLLDSTPRQIYLQQLLDFSTPNYAHVPIVTNLAGEKLSKQTFAEPISISLPEHQLFDALRFLGQPPPAEMKNATLAEVWRWAIANWALVSVPKNRSAPLPAPT